MKQRLTKQHHLGREAVAGTPADDKIRYAGKQAIFRQGSRTYYTSALFFPRKVWEEVAVLYGFVRTADNYVDAIPQDEEGFRSFCRLYLSRLNREDPDRPSSENRTSDPLPIIDSFIALARRRNFDPAWTEAFLHSMELDLTKSVYGELEETLEYIYGSAEVIGLFMNRIMGVSAGADHAARLMGRAMQYINFIRDLDEDARLGRRYLPALPAGLEGLDRRAAEADPDRFCRYVRQQLEQYLKWQHEAEKGYPMLPYRYRVPVKTAADMYAWTAARIARNPMAVFERKIKPRTGRIILQGLFNLLAAAGRAAA